ncbi:site-specific integrase [Mesorhizobium sp. KR9-304]|uniref:site-specific integrase n=1 Tax=Mesorhizobium sp. KR9-304 TaxID=3156614 RepID=UPI0032B42781
MLYFIMATIIERNKKDGTPSFLVQITLKRGGKIAHREAKTFKSRREAQAWGKWREAELDAPGALEKSDDPTLADAIRKYEGDAAHLGRTKSQVLRSLRDTKLAQMRCSTIRAEHVVDLARELAKERSPATVASYMTFLAGVFAVARPAWGYPLDERAMSDALVVAKKFKFVGRSNERERRPTLDEMNRLMAFFAARKADSIPMERLAAFALYSARREGEIVRLRWADFDGDRILVRDAKDPRGAAGNHIWTELTPEAQLILETTPRTDDELIFPFKGDTINFSWRNACNMLGIDDLHFHDLRHEAVSRLFEMGRTIPQVASVSAHRSWQNLKRYAHLRQSGDKWSDWKWLKIVTAKEPA